MFAVHHLLNFYGHVGKQLCTTCWSINLTLLLYLYSCCHHSGVCECSIVLILQKVMTVDGEFITSFGSQGSAFGQLQEPESVTTDAYGNVLVTDYGNGRVMVRESLLSCSSF